MTNTNTLGQVEATTTNKPPSSPQRQPRFRSRYIAEIQSIMYTCGDVKQPSHDTAQLIELLVHDLLQRLLRALALAAVKKNSKTFGAEDLLFLIRHDPLKQSRLREYLQWREVRKMSNSSGPPNTAAAASTTSIIPTAGTDDALLEDVVVADGTATATTSTTTHHRKLKARLPWGLSTLLDQDQLAQGWRDGDDAVLDFIDNHVHDDTRHRLADALTRSMTRAEYLEWTDCRQASFTYKKSKKFREWLSPTAVTDYRVNDEVLEMFGLMAFMFVELLTTAALGVDPVVEDAGGGHGKEGMFAVPLFAKPSAKMALSVDQVKTAMLEISMTDPVFMLI